MVFIQRMTVIPRDFLNLKGWLRGDLINVCECLKVGVPKRWTLLSGAGQ